MFSKSHTSLRRFSGLTLTALLSAACLCAGARAQTAPAAIASFATGVNHSIPGNNKNIGSLGGVANIATDSYGDLLAVDDVNAALYEFPAGGGDAVVLVAIGGLAGTPVNTIVTPGIAIDSANNLYIEGGSCILEFPYSNWSTWGQTPIFTGGATPVTSASACGATGTAPTFYNFGAGSQPWGIAIESIAGSTSLVVGTSPTGASAGGSIVSIPAGALSAPAAGTPVTIVSGMAGAAISIAVDPSGDTYFAEAGTGALSGAYEIPAGQTGLTSDSGVARIDPTLPQVMGVGSDALGNVYISDNTLGVFLLPQGGKPSSATLVSTVTGQGGVAVWGDSTLFVPTNQTQSNNFADVAEVAFGSAQFGAAAVGAKAPAQASVTFTFNASTTPVTINVLEAGKSTPDFAVASATKTCLSTGLQPPYGGSGNPASCPVAVNFAPQAPGNVSATLVMLDKNNNLLGSIPLNGSGTSAAVQVSPAAQSTIGGGLKTPSQMAVDAAGNVYIADSGLGTVEMYPAGAGASATGTAVGQNLKAPTGVAVDGAGDVFIADSGNVYEVPESQIAAGLNANGQITLATGFGSQVQLAADGLGDLYISDATKQTVTELQNFSTGWNPTLPGVLGSQTVALSGAAFSAPSAIAVDPYNNLFVVDGSSVYEVMPGSAGTVVLSGISGSINGLAVDPSGSVYATMNGGAVRIPYTSGTLNTSQEAAVASGVTNPTAVALDSLGNVYVADGTALDVSFTSASASVNFGTVTVDPVNGQVAGSSTTQTVTLLNYGNTPLQVTGYSSQLNYFEPDPSVAGYNEADFNETSDTCSANQVSPDTTCTATITFSPAIGDGGNLTGQVLVQGNVSNMPVGVNGTGVAPTLAGTAPTVTASSQGTIEGVPVSVTVAPSASGSPTPTGTVTLTVQYGKNVPLTNPGLPTKYQITAPLANGTATFDPTQLPIANYTFTARYNGDSGYTYGNSNMSTPVTVATPVPTVLSQPPISASALNTPPAGATQLEPYTLPCTSGTLGSCTTAYSLGQPSSNPPGYLVVGGLCTGCVGSWGFDGSDDQWIFDFDVTVASASGDQMVGLAAYGGGTSQVGWNYGSVNYEMSSGQSLCGSQAGSSSIINAVDVANQTDIESATFPVTCGAVNNVNTTIPVFMAYYTFTPVYSGSYNDLSENNPNYTGSKGTPVSIWSVAHPVVQINSNPPALTVAAGSSVTATLSVSSVLGYGFIDRGGTGAGNPNYAMPLALQCQGLPAYASCSFSYPTPNPADQQSVAYAAGSVVYPNDTVYPQSIPAFAGLLCQNSNPASPTYCAFDVGPALGSVNSHSSSTTPCDATTDGCLGPAQIMLTITTNVPIDSASNSKTYKSGIAFAGLFGMCLLGLGFRKRARRFGWLVMVACLLLGGGAFASITACTTKTLGTASTGVTPNGNYWVTITASQVGIFVVPSTTKGVPPVLATANGQQMSLPYTINVTVGGQ